MTRGKRQCSGEQGRGPIRSDERKLPATSNYRDGKQELLKGDLLCAFLERPETAKWFSPEQVCEAKQQAYTELLNSIDRGRLISRDPKHMRAIFNKAVGRVLMRPIREARSRPAHVDLDKVGELPDEDSDWQLETNGLSELVQKHVNRAGKDRDLFRMVYLDNVSPERVGEMFGLSGAAVRMRLHRFRKLTMNRVMQDPEVSDYLGLLTAV